MGKVIQFPTKRNSGVVTCSPVKAPLVDKGPETNSLNDRLERIKASIGRINKLMGELKHMKPDGFNYNEDER